MSPLIAQMGVPALIQILSQTLSKSDHPVAQGAEAALHNLEQALQNGDISTAKISEMNRHAEALAQIQQDSDKIQITEINQSLRAEIASNDPYVRRMRPTFGYIMAITWAAQMLALAWVILDNPRDALILMQGFDSMGLIWCIALSVLGIYVYKRSDDKKGLMGQIVDKMVQVPLDDTSAHGASKKPESVQPAYNEG